MKEIVMREIPLFDIQGFRAGHAQNEEAGTGLTVFLFDRLCPVGADIRGGGPAGRETALLDTGRGTNGLHALVLSGGSAFGLGAADGVMKYLEERGIGFDVGVTHVPLVCQSCIFDLTVGSVHVRPTAQMAYEACVNTRNDMFAEGCVGAGTGASVGKVCGMDYAMKSGIGAYALEYEGIQVGAAAVVNALGDVYDPEKNEKIAGVLAEDKQSFSEKRTAQSEILKTLNVSSKNLFVSEDNSAESVQNTTLGIIFTNARFDKGELSKIASMTHNAYARCISPVHTMADGDTIYAVSLGEKKADINAFGILAQKAMEKALARAVTMAKTMYGLPCYGDIKK